MERDNEKIGFPLYLSKKFAGQCENDHAVFKKNELKFPDLILH